MLRAALAVILLAGCAAGGADVARDDAGRPTEAGVVRADNLRVGDCFDDQEDQTPDAFPIVPCEEPHDNEVFARIRVPGDDYPGVDAVADLAATDCRGEAFETYVGEPFEGSGLEVFYQLPSDESWGKGDRDVLCALYDEGGARLSGSRRGAG